MKNTLLFCTGLSGSGKSYFIQNTLPAGLFYKLKSATTRPMRDDEIDGQDYYFRDELYLENEPMVTNLWVNREFWTPGMPKWMYGVPEFEVHKHLGENLVYDVIEPRYAREMIDWFRARGLDHKYNFRVAFFIAPQNNFETAAARANMPGDLDVRRTNTCDPVDFMRAGLEIDYLMMPRAGMLSPALMRHIARLQHRQHHN